MEAFKESLLNEIKSEIRNTARKEILEEVKKKFQKFCSHCQESLPLYLYIK